MFRLLPVLYRDKIFCMQSEEDRTDTSMLGVEERWRQTRTDQTEREKTNSLSDGHMRRRSRSISFALRIGTARTALRRLLPVLRAVPLAALPVRLLSGERMLLPMERNMLRPIELHHLRHRIADRMGHIPKEGVSASGNFFALCFLWFSACRHACSFAC